MSMSVEGPKGEITVIGHLDSEGFPVITIIPSRSPMRIEDVNANGETTATFQIHGQAVVTYPNPS